MLKKKYPFVLQHDSTDCAAAAIATVLLHYKVEKSIAELRDMLGTDLLGTTVKGMVSCLELLKFNVKAVKCSIDEMDHKITLPCIAQTINKAGLSHFVVIYKIKKNRQFIVADPEIGIRKLNNNQVNDELTGIFIFLSPKSDFEKSKQNKRNISEIFTQLILPQKKLFATAILCSLVLSIIGIVMSVSSKILIDEIIPHGLKKSLILFLIVFGIVTVIQALLNFFRTHVLLFLTRKIDIPVLMGYYNHILCLSYSFFSSRKTGDIITRFQDAMTIKEIFTSTTLSLVLDIFLSIFSGIILYLLNSKLFAIVLVMILINTLLIYIFKQPYKKINYELMENSSKLNSHLIETISNISTIKCFNNERNQIDDLENKFVNSLKTSYRAGIIQNAQGLISNLIGILGNLVFTGIGASLIIDGKMSIGDLILFQSLSTYFSGPIQNIISLQITFQEAQIAIKRLNELMDIPPEKKSFENISNIKLDGSIEFKNISFSYGMRKPIIDSFNLKVDKGEKIAIVGKSGVGKSTIAKLLLKFIDANSGQITISDYNIQNIDRSYLRSKIAYISQETQLFSGTVLDNITMKNNSYSMEDIIKITRFVGADDFISNLPNQYGTYVEEGGSNFSGGEKQKIAIARALLKNSDIYIFDEATSNLDANSEIQIQNFILRELKDKTVIIIAHRLSTIINCNRICFMENGKITEMGTHEKLMKIDKNYAKMYKKQNAIHSFIEQTVG